MPNRNHLLCLSVFACLSLGAEPVAPTATVDVWPADKMPGVGAKEAEADLPARGDNVQRVTNISRPTLAVFAAKKSEKPTPAAIVLPGGGYGYLCYDKEGTEAAAWLNSVGITALVLKYRAPNNREGAFQDLQRALSLAREKAVAWNIDPKQLGVLGFSAGGHLAARASNRFDERAYPGLDAIDKHSCRPDFAVLVYPAYLGSDGKVSADLNLKAKIPPTIIVHSEDDKTHVVGSKIYHAALTEAKLPGEFKNYPTGGHGYGMRCIKDAKAWPEDVVQWLRKSVFTHAGERKFEFKPGKPGVFTVAVEEGNHEVTIRFGDPTEATSTTIKAESRRLMVERVDTLPGTFETRTFLVNVRKPVIGTGGVVKLNDREKGPPAVPDWDDVLGLEFNGKRPGVVSVEIRPARDAVTVFLAGDSTVTDQVHEPYAGWGQMLPRFFGPGVAVSNHAESGLALTSFEGQKRLDKLLSTMRKGDYLFLQFGHNDQKDKRPEAGPFTTYKANLKRFVAAAREKGGIPVLVTPMERRRFDGEGKPVTTLADFATAVRQVGSEEKVPVIDLHAMSLKLYAALGPEKSARAFVHYPAKTFPGQDRELKDDTHHNAYGGYELARCVVEGIRTSVPALAANLAKDAGAFDPANPDAPEKVDIPASPATGAPVKPEGS